MYNDTCTNWSCSKTETLLGRTDTFDLVCFLYASLSRISKAKTVKRALLQTDNFFSPQIKKATCFTHTQRTILRIPRNRELNWTFLSIFSKKPNVFYTLKQQWLFLISFYSFEGVRYFWVKLYIFFFQVALCNRPTLVLCHWKQYRTGTFKPYSTPLWTSGFSIVTYTEVSKTCRRLHKKFRRHIPL